MRGEKDLLANLVNFSVMEYFPHCYHYKCPVKFSFKDSSQRSKAHQPNRLSIRKLGYMLVAEGGECPHRCRFSELLPYMSSFLEDWPETVALPGLERTNQLTRISDPFMRFEAALLLSARYKGFQELPALIFKDLLKFEKRLNVLVLQHLKIYATWNNYSCNNN